jgi:hypothetical protein
MGQGELGKWGGHPWEWDRWDPRARFWRRFTLVSLPILIASMGFFISSRDVWWWIMLAGGALILVEKLIMRLFPSTRPSKSMEGFSLDFMHGLGLGRKQRRR